MCLTKYWTHLTAVTLQLYCITDQKCLLSMRLKWRVISFLCQSLFANWDRNMLILWPETAKNVRLWTSLCFHDLAAKVFCPKMYSRVHHIYIVTYLLPTVTHCTVSESVGVKCLLKDTWIMTCYQHSGQCWGQRRQSPWAVHYPDIFRCFHLTWILIKRHCGCSPMWNWILAKILYERAVMVLCGVSWPYVGAACPCWALLLSVLTFFCINHMFEVISFFYLNCLHFLSKRWKV